MHVVATAGHVDHGKSTLVQALTGIDPDRFAEEKARGLTIDLGFAWTTLPSGRELAFVDVPGHVRFIKNMLAGVGAVDACLFVVAATEGWKPQSEEHLRILELLGTSHGLVALTKIGLVDDEWRGRVRGGRGGQPAGGCLVGPPGGGGGAPAAPVGGGFRVYRGSGGQAAQLGVLGRDAVGAGGDGLVRVHLPVALPLLPGDRFVLRESGRSETVGGGEVLDVQPMLPAAAARPDRSVDRVIDERGWV